MITELIYAFKLTSELLISLISAILKYLKSLKDIADIPEPVSI